MTNVHIMTDNLWNVFGMKTFKLTMSRSQYYYHWIIFYLSFINSIPIYESQEGAIICSPETIQCFLNARKEMMTKMVEGDYKKR